MVAILHSVYAFLISPVRKNRIINYFLFGFIPSNKNFGGFWDWTTLEIKLNINKYFKKGMSFLDVGTGPFATLSVYVKRKFKDSDVTASDYLPELICNAKLQPLNDSILFIESDLFEKINGCYDFIAFNAPYLTTELGRKFGVLTDEFMLKRLSGGVDGTQTIKRFMDTVCPLLTENGICLIGVNHFYVKHNEMKLLIDNNKKLNLISYSKSRMTKSGVYLFKKKTL